MAPEEVGYLATGKYNSQKVEWEKHRAILHAIFASQASKPLKPEDIMVFPWEKTPTKEVSKEDIEEIRDRIRRKFNTYKNEE